MMNIIAAAWSLHSIAGMRYPESYDDTKTCYPRCSIKGIWTHIWAVMPTYIVLLAIISVQMTLDHYFGSYSVDMTRNSVWEGHNMRLTNSSFTVYFLVLSLLPNVAYGIAFSSIPCHHWPRKACAPPNHTINMTERSHETRLTNPSNLMPVTVLAAPESQTSPV